MENKIKPVALDDTKGYPQRIIGVKNEFGHEFILYVEWRNGERKFSITDSNGLVIDEKKKIKIADRNPTFWEIMKQVIGIPVNLQQYKEINNNHVLMRNVRPHIDSLTILLDDPENKSMIHHADFVLKGVVTANTEDVKFISMEVDQGIVLDESTFRGYLKEWGFEGFTPLFNIQARFKSDVWRACQRVFKSGKAENILAYPEYRSFYTAISKF